MRLIILLVSLLFSVSLIADQAQLAEDVRFHPRFKGVPIPHEIALDGKGVITAPLGEVTVQSPIVVATVNGEGPFYFMVDTGFSTTLLSKEVAKAAKLTWVRTMGRTASTPSQVVKTSEELYIAESINIGPLTLKDFGVFTVSKDNPEYEILQKDEGRGIDGIIGFNAFYGLIMTLDYQNETIEVTKESLVKGDPHVAPISVISSVPQIKLKLVFDKLKTERDQNFVIDTGAFPYFFINSCELPQMKKFVGKEQILGRDFQGNEGENYFAQLYGKIQIMKDYAIQSPYIVYSASNCKKNNHGLLGRKFFQLHKVSIDVDDFLVKIVPYKKSKP